MIGRWLRRRRMMPSVPTQRTARAIAPTALGWASLLGGILGGFDVLAPGVLQDGWRTWLFAAMMAVLVVLGVVLLRIKRASDLAVTILVLLSFPIYVVVSMCVVNASTYAPPLMMLFGAIAGAAILSLRAFALNCLLLVGAVTLTLVPEWPGSTIALGVQIAVQSLVLLITSIGIFVLRRRGEALLEYSWELARRDPLTQLANRLRCEEFAADRLPGQTLAFIALDLDLFKQINDTHGHAVGDDVLRAAATAVAQATSEGLAARIGGEEFLVLTPIDDPDYAVDLATRLNQAVRNCPSPLPITCSVGVTTATVPGEGPCRTDWLWHQVSIADRALYEAKKAGRDQVVDSDPPSVPAPGPRPRELSPLHVP